MRDPVLISMKRYYFAMETSLASHLGESKNDLHENIVKHTQLGRTVDPETGEIVYESISDIYDIGRMMYRIVEFQRWAALEFKYTFEPFKTDKDDQLGTTELESD